MHQLKVVHITSRAVLEHAYTEPIPIKSASAIKLGLVRAWLAEIETLVTRIETTIGMCEKNCSAKVRK